MTRTLQPTTLTQSMLAHQGGRQGPPELVHPETREEIRETREEPGAAGPTRCLRCQEGGQAEAQAKTEEGTTRGQGSKINPLPGDRCTAVRETGEDKFPRG